MTITIRGWKGYELIFERLFDADDPRLPHIGGEHANRMVAGEIDMVEMVFPDGQHLRFGLNPAGMLLPIEIDLEDLPAAAERLSKDPSIN